MTYQPLKVLQEKILSLGGTVNSHSHIDRAYTVTPEDMTSNVELQLQQKWKKVDQYKRNTTEEGYYKNMYQALSLHLNENPHITAILSFIDCDPVVENKAINAALNLKPVIKEKFGVDFLIANQTLKGVFEKRAKKFFLSSLADVDIVGSLPSADGDNFEKHIEYVLRAAKDAGKRVHVHVDQLNSPHERETEVLARKAIQVGYEGMVTAVHGISIAAHTHKYRKDLYWLCRDAGLSFVSCPTAWIDSRRREWPLVPSHNAITPIDELIPEGLTVAIGTDNICDIYKPFCHGDLWTELRVLLESTHFYNIDELAKIITVNGKKVLGIL
jgi:cytosine/adenosine deaminase-related metal-dependent hydrolase